MIVPAPLIVVEVAGHLQLDPPRLDLAVDDLLGAA
jgi:hypothetical protein